MREPLRIRGFIRLTLMGHAAYKRTPLMQAACPHAAHCWRFHRSVKYPG